MAHYLTDYYMIYNTHLTKIYNFYLKHLLMWQAFNPWQITKQLGWFGIVLLKLPQLNRSAYLSLNTVFLSVNGIQCSY
jgi:hypothetical protein